MTGSRANFYLLVIFSVIHKVSIVFGDITVVDLDQSRGEFMSDGYPDSPGGLKGWRIMVDEGFRIHLQFLDFALNESVACILDYVQLYDGPESTYPEVGRWCWDEYTELVPKSFTSSENSFFLFYRGHLFYTRKGFKARYVALDIDECRTGNGGCDVISTTCENTEGSFQCLCKSGFTHSGSFTECDDINECGMVPAKCDPMSTMCVNTIGGFRCNCLAGFVVDPLSNTKCRQKGSDPATQITAVTTDRTETLSITPTQFKGPVTTVTINYLNTEKQENTGIYVASGVGVVLILVFMFLLICLACACYRRVSRHREKRGTYDGGEQNNGDHVHENENRSHDQGTTSLSGGATTHGNDDSSYENNIRSPTSVKHLYHNQRLNQGSKIAAYEYDYAIDIHGQDNTPKQGSGVIEMNEIDTARSNVPNEQLGGSPHQTKISYENCR